MDVRYPYATKIKYIHKVVPRNCLQT